MSSSHKSLLVWLLWLGSLAAAGLWLLGNLQLRSDLTAFLPAAKGDQERLILEALEDGAASRLMPVAIEAADIKVAASISRRMAAKLREDEQFRQILNGQQSLEPEQLEWVMAHRYLLSDAVDAEHFSVSGIKTALQERLRELGSAEELAVKDLLARDPLHDSLAAASQWRPAHEPETHRGVWVDPDNTRALLMLETRAAGFDLDAQEVAIASIREVFDATIAAQGVDARLLMTGPGPFGVELRRTTQSESQWFSTLAVVILMVFLFVMYRSVRWVIIGALPLGSGLLAGLLIVSTAYGGMHGITLAFAVTLLGVAIDYPLHLFSHQSTGAAASNTVRLIWPTMRLGVASTCIAYLTMVVSDFQGLAQLGWLTVIGLAVAAATTRWMLPLLMTSNEHRFDAATTWAVKWQHLLNNSPRLPWWLMLVIIAVLLAWLANRPQLWQNDLGSLTPVSAENQQLDYQLRRALAAPDLRYLAVLQADSAEQALQSSEALGAALKEAVAQGLITGFDSPSRYLPSQQTQARRRAALPEAQVLSESLVEARQDMPFKADLFEPFIAEVSAARKQLLLTPESMQAAPVAAALNGLLKSLDDGQWRATLPMQGVADAEALEAWFAQRDGATLLDLKQSSENMVAGFRQEMLWRIAAATGLILALLLLGLSPRRRWLFVLLPVIATVLLTASIMQMAGTQLSLFHMTSLMLVGGIVLDYALFFDREEQDPAEATRTLHALSVCCVSTLTVFGILGLSQIPVLRAIGATVACGVLVGYFLAVMGRRHR